MTRASAKAIVLPILNKTIVQWIVVPNRHYSFGLAGLALSSEMTRGQKRLAAQRFVEAADTLERLRIVNELKRIGAIG